LGVLTRYPLQSLPRSIGKGFPFLSLTLHCSTIKIYLQNVIPGEAIIL